MNLYGGVYDSLGNRPHGDRVLAGLFVAGAAGAAVFGLFDVAQGAAWALVVVYALLGAAILPVAELASRWVRAWWAKGLVLGVTAGLLIGLCSHALFGEEPLLVSLLANVVGCSIGGLFWKHFGESAARQNGTAARMR